MPRYVLQFLAMATIVVAPGFVLGGEVSFRAKYVESANGFRILDCVSSPDAGCGDDGEYRKDWENRFGRRTADKQTFEKYREIRARSLHPTGKAYSAQNLFAIRDEESEDPIAAAFIGAGSPNEALRRLESTLSGDDQAFLWTFYERFRDQLSPYMSESASFRAAAERLDTALHDPRFARFFQEVERFYGVDEDIRYTVLYVWWPPLERDYAFPLQDHLVLAKNPGKHLSWPDEDDVFHEIVHTISARQSARQKLKFSKAFSAICRPDTTHLRVLEEPLAVAIGGMLFLKRFDHQRFSETSNWYNDRWVQRFAPRIFPMVEQYFSSGRQMDLEFVRRAAQACRSSLVTR